MRRLRNTLLVPILLLHCSRCRRLRCRNRMRRRQRAQNAYWQVEQDLQVAQSGCKSLSQAVEQVKRQYRAAIISAETKRQGIEKSTTSRF